MMTMMMTMMTVTGGAGGRYESVTDGLRIKNATLSDDGEYTCRAEVEKDGRYDERKITVAVHSTSSLLEV